MLLPSERHYKRLQSKKAKTVDFEKPTYEWMAGIAVCACCGTEINGTLLLRHLDYYHTIEAYCVNCGSKKSRKQIPRRDSMRDASDFLNIKYCRRCKAVLELRETKEPWWWCNECKMGSG